MIKSPTINRWMSYCSLFFPEVRVLLVLTYGIIGVDRSWFSWSYCPFLLCFFQVLFRSRGRMVRPLRTARHKGGELCCHVENTPQKTPTTLPKHSQNIPEHSQNTPKTLAKSVYPNPGTLARLPLQRYITLKTTRKMINEWAAMYTLYCIAHGSLIEGF